MNIIKTSGFQITSKGYPNLDMGDKVWEMKEDFYFDNQDQLEQFKKGLESFFNEYVGEVQVETFEERK